jgi:hypothetical protein
MMGYLRRPWGRQFTPRLLRVRSGEAGTRTAVSINGVGFRVVIEVRAWTTKEVVTPLQLFNGGEVGDVTVDGVGVEGGADEGEGVSEGRRIKSNKVWREKTRSWSISSGEVSEEGEGRVQRKDLIGCGRARE